MALSNLNIVVDSKFDPLSFSDLAAPYIMYKQEFDKQQEALGELETKASIWEGMADKEKDPLAYAKYKAYADNLRSVAGTLATRGLTPSSKTALLNMKADYASRITPIENAYNRRQQLADEQRKMIAQNPTMLYQRMANKMSLDDFVTNPQADYGQQYNGALLTQMVSNAAANIAKEARDSKDGKGVLAAIGLENQYQFIKQNGFSRDAVMKAILRSADANRILTGLVDNAIAASGVLNWGDAETIQRAYNYASQGLYSAIGETQSQILTDVAGQARLQNSLDKDKMRLQSQLNMREDDHRTNNNIRLEKAKAAIEAQKQANTPLFDGNFPLYTTELTQGAQVDKKEKKSITDAKSNLGIIAPEDSKHKQWMRQTISVNAPASFSTASQGYIGETPKATNKNNTTKFNVFHSNGALLTRHQFIMQGKTDRDRKILNDYYTNVIIPSVHAVTRGGIQLKQDGSINGTNGKSINYAKLRDEYRSAMNKSNATRSIGFELRNNNTLDVLSSQVLPNSSNGARLKIIKGYDSDGHPILGDTTFAKDFINKEGKLLYGTNIKPTFYTQGSDNDAGLIMNYNGKSFYIPAGAIGRGSGYTSSYVIEDKAALRELAEKYEYYKSNFPGFEKSPGGQKMLATLQLMGVSRVIDDYNALFGTYKSTPIDTNETSQDKL